MNQRESLKSGTNIKRNFASGERSQYTAKFIKHKSKVPSTKHKIKRCLSI
jgi:hypothetical protein